MLLKQRKAKSKTKLTKQEDSINLLVWFYNLIFNYYGKNYRKNKKGEFIVLLLIITLEFLL